MVSAIDICEIFAGHVEKEDRREALNRDRAEAELMIMSFQSRLWLPRYEISFSLLTLECVFAVHFLMYVIQGVPRWI